MGSWYCLCLTWSLLGAQKKLGPRPDRFQNFRRASSPLSYAVSPPPPAGKSSTFISQLFFFRLCYTYTHEPLKKCCISNTVLRPIEMITLSHWLHLPTWKKFGEHGCGWICKTVYSTWDKGLVHTYPFLFENRDIFSPVWNTVHTVKNGHRKRIFWKTLSRVDISENAILLHSRVWMGEKEGFWKQLLLDVGNQLLRMLPSKMVLFTTVIIYCLICGRAETIKKTQRVNANYWKRRKTDTCEQGQNLGYDSELLVDSFVTYAYYRCIGPYEVFIVEKLESNNMQWGGKMCRLYGYAANESTHECQSWAGKR